MRLPKLYQMNLNYSHASNQLLQRQRTISTVSFCLQYFAYKSHDFNTLQMRALEFSAQAYCFQDFSRSEYPKIFAVILPAISAAGSAGCV
jgi:hypothetical protein